MKEAYVALGANLGERHLALREALGRMACVPGLEVRRISGVYETDPVGYTDQPAFLNMAAAVATDLEPEALLETLLRIEQEMGRVREIRWGPRTIDLDLLLYEGVEMETETLTLPHPRMGERAFVLVPLRDVWRPEASFPWDSLLNAEAVEAAGIRLRGRLDLEENPVTERSGQDA
ncbi:2-amino-4-hydroxy-6-hydroxymethyldihydropteridine diphosphokinase [Cohnella sp. CFH 77786]|uniref:2-amino-4-hydroxy-6- hydroxymethyldihydropteridine diphosphokinase n=1 Tax=Cohnella sp. CFH 77786 TaxID=2662265 RepID=UPI001C60EFD7|nr:2-amino-4-hydroxy-6-hydroxymethyldihydropteridine diphosphokinase [Cohnella sp. CFH 77786]MBW5449003.1 2-amino-4-hydroxy-6-hydroxymethyldihydropteridine diphosphokinase [Cohnella sp. CFH 77786]